MLVHDVVQIVDPGANTSTPAGRWLVNFFPTIMQADHYAETCRERCTVDGIRYIVESHDDEATDRAFPLR